MKSPTIQNLRLEMKGLFSEMYEILLKPPHSEMLLSWAEKHNWAKDMMYTVQDHIFHQEGDVWTHTKLVCQALEKDPDWLHITDENRHILLWAALLHDIGKPKTTKKEFGRVTSPKHAKLGSKMARSILTELGTDFNTRETICNLIKQHTKPAHTWDEDTNIENQIVDLSWLCDIKLLYKLVLADFKGRICPDKETIVDNLHLWNMYVGDMLKEGRPYQFENDHSRFLWFQRALSHRVYKAYEDFSCNVTMLSGLPGSGKDTYAAKNYDGPVVSIDFYRQNGEAHRAVEFAQEQVREYLRKREDFCFNATNLSLDIRKKWITLFSDYKARTKIIYIEPPMARLLEQNQNRDHAVPLEALDQMFGMLDIPTFTECHDLEYIVK